MRVAIGLILGIFIFLINFTYPVRAIYDPLSVPNNQIGVHIFDPAEIYDAARLVNSSGGDWGYLTVPIRSDDRDRIKWTEFFTACRRLHLIPIVRLATFVDHDHWVAPTSYDLLDFANFLSDMPWPTLNRYVILFNEPNHSKEWGGRVSPDEYAAILADARVIFKSRSDRYYLLSAGLDMSAPSNDTSLDALEFYRRLSLFRPDWYQAVDAISVHAYPNPAFSASPYTQNRYGISSFRYEADYLSRLGYPSKPLFITETGTINQSGFYLPAITQIWTDRRIVAITPFALFAGAGDFTRFSLLDLSHQPTTNYKELLALGKRVGSPLLDPDLPPLPPISPGVTAAAAQPTPSRTTSTPARLPVWLNTILTRIGIIFSSPSSAQVNLNGRIFQVEISATDSTRTRGLSGRSSLPLHRGMLFIFSHPDIYPFWMPDMHFPLDIIWLRSGKVVTIAHSVPPPPPGYNKADLPIYKPDSPADMVLEINAGLSRQYGLQIGDTVKMDL